MLQESANHGCDACRGVKGMFFFWGQPSRHLFHFKINRFWTLLGQKVGRGKLSPESAR
jgi:hypothetical protein